MGKSEDAEGEGEERAREEKCRKECGKHPGSPVGKRGDQARANWVGEEKWERGSESASLPDRRGESMRVREIAGGDRNLDREHSDLLQGREVQRGGR